MFTGNVVAVQGDSTMKCTTLTVFYEPRKGEAAGRREAGPRARGAGLDRQADQEDRLQGPGHHRLEDADRDRRQRHLRPASPTRSSSLGNVALTDGPNVTRGERIVYDLNTGVANVETNAGRAA